MILIISHDGIDEPTNDVIDWLSYYKSNFCRINGDDFYLNKNFIVNYEKKTIKFGNNLIKSKDVNSILFRRWLNKPTSFIDEFKTNEYDLYGGYFLENYLTYIKSELTSISSSIFSLFSENVFIPSYKISRGQLNKFDVLLKAENVGIKIPKSFIASSKFDILKEIKDGKEFITKSIKDADFIFYDKLLIDLYTKPISVDKINKLSDTFFPTLFQEKVEKLFEIRIFYFFEKMYSMAIFSQNDSKTSVDFRNYNRERPNRYIPFKLPLKIEKKIKQLMNEVDLNTGSIDMIYSVKGEYIFLEVNPVGQIGMVSKNCNYPIEKEIALTLIKNDRIGILQLHYSSNQQLIWCTVHCNTGMFLYLAVWLAKYLDLPEI